MQEGLGTTRAVEETVRYQTARDTIMSERESQGQGTPTSQNPLLVAALQVVLVDAAIQQFKLVEINCCPMTSNVSFCTRTLDPTRLSDVRFTAEERATQAGRHYPCDSAVTH